MTRYLALVNQVSDAVAEFDDDLSILLFFLSLFLDFRKFSEGSQGIWSTVNEQQNWEHRRREKGKGRKNSGALFEGGKEARRRGGVKAWRHGMIEIKIETETEIE